MWQTPPFWYVRHTKTNISDFSEVLFSQLIIDMVQTDLLGDG